MFDGAKFAGSALFREAEFSGRNVWFSRAEFRGLVWFSRARARPVEGRVFFWPATWSTREAGEGEEDGWLYLVRVEE